MVDKAVQIRDLCGQCIPLPMWVSLGKSGRSSSFYINSVGSVLCAAYPCRLRPRGRMMKSMSVAALLYKYHSSPDSSFEYQG